MASGMYNQFKAEVMKGTFDLVNDTVKVALMDENHSFNPDDTGFAAVQANEISGTGYTAGGATLASKAVTQDDTDDEGVFDADNPAWPNATFSCYHAVLYDDTPSSPADPLIGSIDFGGVQSVASGAFSIVWADEGIVNIN